MTLKVRRLSILVFYPSFGRNLLKILSLKHKGHFKVQDWEFRLVLLAFFRILYKNKILRKQTLYKKGNLLRMSTEPNIGVSWFILLDTKVVVGKPQYFFAHFMPYGFIRNTITAKSKWPYLFSESPYVRREF